MEPKSSTKDLLLYVLGAYEQIAGLIFYLGKVRLVQSEALVEAMEEGKRHFAAVRESIEKQEKEPDQEAFDELFRSLKTPIQ